VVVPLREIERQAQEEQLRAQVSARRPNIHVASTTQPDTVGVCQFASCERRCWRC
jgi:hypothetical protein